jgi:hypothetical protein
MAEQTPDEISQAFVDFLEDEVNILKMTLYSINLSHFHFSRKTTVIGPSSAALLTANNVD